MRSLLSLLRRHTSAWSPASLPPTGWEIRSRIELTSLTNLKRAAWLDPGNAEYRNRLGRFYDLVSRDPASAVGQYRAAVQLNPHSATYWFDLASAYQVLGDTVNQTSALERAIQADSMTPDVAWQAANLYLVQGENEKALREFRVVLANDSSLAPTAIQFCWRIQPDVDVLLRDVVPPRGDAYIAFLSLLQDDVNRQIREITSPPADAVPPSPEQLQNKVTQIQKETDATFKVWNALVESRQTFERRYAYDYFQFLIQQKEVDQAVMVWQQTADTFGLTQYLPSSSNLIVDGSFKLPVLNAGFDWQHQKQDGVQLTLDSNESHSGRHSGRSLMITFDGPGVRRCWNVSAHRRSTQHHLQFLGLLQERRDGRAPAAPISPFRTCTPRPFITRVKI